MSPQLRKYFSLAHRAFEIGIVYRSESILWLILDTLPILTMIFVWSSIYRGSDEAIRGLTFPQILSYYFLSLTIDRIIASHFEQWRVRQIREGAIDYYLTRPLSYLAELFWFSVGNKAYYLVLAIPSIGLMYVLLDLFYPMATFPASPAQLAGFFLLLGAGYLIEYLFAVATVLFGFWFEHSEGLEHFKWLVISLFSGSIIPVAMMPDWLQRLTTALPFQYMYAVPIELAQGTRHLSWPDLVYVGGFIGLFWLATILLWRRAQLHYTSAGG